MLPLVGVQAPAGACRLGGGRIGFGGHAVRILPGGKGHAMVVRRAKGSIRDRPESLTRTVQVRTTPSPPADGRQRGRAAISSKVATMARMAPS